VSKHNPPIASFSEAEKYFSRSDYLQASERYLDFLLDSPNNPLALTRLSVCFLCNSEYEKADKYVQKALHQDSSSSEALMISAFLDLFFDREAAALHKYAQLMSRQYKIKKIKKILNELKKFDNTANYISGRSARYFLPTYPFPLQKRILILSLGAVAAVLLIFLILGLNKWLDTAHLNSSETLYVYGSEKSFSLTSAIKNLEEIYMFDGLQAGTYEYSSKEINNYFNQMKRYIKRGNINEAVIIYNRIQNSDVNILIKEKFNLLASAQPLPNFFSFKNIKSLKTILKNQDLYKNIYVKYAGTVTSFRRKKEVIFFDFTVQDEGDTWTTQVYLDKVGVLAIGNDQKYLLLGRFRGFDKRLKKIILKGIVLQEFVN